MPGVPDSCASVPICRDTPLAEPGSYLIPPQLCLLCQGETGRLYSFGLNLRDTFSAVRDSGKLTAVRPSGRSVDLPCAGEATAEGAAALS